MLRYFHPPPVDHRPGETFVECVFASMTSVGPGHIPGHQQLRRFPAARTRLRIWNLQRRLIQFCLPFERAYASRTGAQSARRSPRKLELPSTYLPDRHCSSSRNVTTTAHLLASSVTESQSGGSVGAGKKWSGQSFCRREDSWRTCPEMSSSGSGTSPADVDMQPNEFQNGSPGRFHTSDWNA